MKCVKQFLLFVCLLVCSLSLLRLVRLEWMLCWNMVPGIEMRRSVNKWIWYFLQTVPKIYLHAAITWQLWNETIMKFCLMFETTRIHQGDWILWRHFNFWTDSSWNKRGKRWANKFSWILNSKKQKPKVCCSLPNPNGDAEKNIMIFFSISESASTVTHSFSFMGNDFS